MRKNLILILCLSLITVFTGCNNEQNNINKKETDLTNTSSTKSTKINSDEQIIEENNEISQKVSKIDSNFKLHEGTYSDNTIYYTHNISKISNYCEIKISNVTDTSFDFTIYDFDRDNGNSEVIFNTNTAVFDEDGTSATFNGNDHTLNFSFTNIADIEVSGFKPLEDKTYVNNSIKELKVYEGTYWDERCFGGDAILEVKNYCEIAISNITNTSFNFTVYDVERETQNKKVILNTNTAVFNEDGTKATYNGNDYTIEFILTNIPHIEISGFEELEGRTYLNNRIPGHEYS